MPAGHINTTLYYTVEQKTGACLDKPVHHEFGMVITHLQARSSIVSSASDLPFVFLKTVSIHLVPSTHCLHGYQIAITGGLCCLPQRSAAPLRFSYKLLSPLPLSQTLCDIFLPSHFSHSSNNLPMIRFLKSRIYSTPNSRE